MQALQFPVKSCQLISELQSQIEQILEPHMSAATDYALVDFPHHSNVGDSAIWLGEIIYLTRKFGKPPSYVCSYYDWSADEFLKAVPSGPIFIHGGGNFGDLWQDNQEFRLRMLSSFPDRQIVQMPQTIHFSSEAGLARASEVINAHPNFTVFARDLRSLKIAKDSFTVPSYLCPDMAFCLGAQKNNASKTRDLLLLLRTDIEGKKHEYGGLLPASASVEDWLLERRGVGKLSYCKAWIQTFLSKDRTVASALDLRLQWFQNLATGRAARGLNQLASANYVITDRLHAHILSVLLDLPHAVVDNSYGKLGTFIETWTRPFGNVSGPLPGVREAIEIYRINRKR